MSNFIHPTAIIDPTVSMGENNFIGPYCYIAKGAVIGSNNRFESFCSIATPPEYIGYMNEEKEYFSVHIGNNNIIRDGVVITGGVRKNTHIGDNVHLLSKAYIAHDVCIEDNVTCSANTSLAGFVHVMEGANFGMGVLCHQGAIVGAYSMIGMGTVITKKTIIEPGKIYIGSPARYLKENEVGLSRASISNEKMNILRDRFYMLKEEENI